MNSVYVAPGTAGPLSAWVAAIDVDSTNGCMQFIPKSHLLPYKVSAVPLSQNIGKGDERKEKKREEKLINNDTKMDWHMQENI